MLSVQKIKRYISSLETLALDMLARFYFSVKGSPVRIRVRLSSQHLLACLKR
jgi:hypothetical protein